MTGPVRPFTVDVPQSVLDHIAAKLALSETGYRPADDDGRWAYGTDATWLGQLLDYWRTDYDWRATEAQLNRLTQFKAVIDDIDLHFIHVRAESGRGFPLLLTHGWPGSVLEFAEIFAPLTKMGFDIIAPSLPGFAFSSRPATPIGPRRVAGLFRRLMTEVLGYRRFGAQGGDWGSAVTTWLGRDHADVVAAIHLNLFLAPNDPTDDDEATAEWRKNLQTVQTMESAYMMEQATKPQTIGLALAASPLGFAAWVTEKFHSWGDTGGDIERRFSKDQLLGNLMLYLVNDAVQSSIWIYRSIFTEPRSGPRVQIPTGCALFPAEFMPYPPRSGTERAYNVVRWTQMEAGGHFAAMEEPAAFAREVGAFFASI